MTQEQKYDVVVIGAGSAGVRFARMAAQQGARVAIAEGRYYGGTCVNVGCVPKKLYVYAAQFQETFRECAGFGWSIPGQPVFEWSRLKSNRAREISRLNQIYTDLLDRAGVDRYWGSAEFISDQAVSVDGNTLTADRFVVATGAWPYVPSFAGNEWVKTSNEFFDLPELPKRCLILGAGYIGVELACIMNRLGVEVSLAFRGERILKGFDQELCQALTEQLQASGIELLPQHQPEKLTPVDRAFDMRFVNGAQGTFNCVIAATGRRPFTQGLNLSAVGVRCNEQGAVSVDEHFKTSVPHIYALGDVIDRMALTPVALGEAMVLVDNLFGQAPPRTMDYNYVPTVVFSQPNIGSVGLTEEAAAQLEESVAVYSSQFTPMKSTLGGGHTRAMCKILVSEQSQRILGVHVMGPDAGEVLQGFAVALKLKATMKDFHQTVGIHPTFAEELVTMRQPVRHVGGKTHD